MKGRADDLWIRQTAAQPTDEMLRTLALAGFAGVYVDREGYPDGGALIESRLAESLHRPPAVSANRRLAFYELADFSARLAAQFSPGELAVLRRRALHPVLVRWGSGFFDLEIKGDENWRWCEAEGEMIVTNSSDVPRQVQIEMTLASGHSQFSALRLSGPLWDEEFKIDHFGQSTGKTLTVPPGDHAIKLACDARRVVAPSDPRRMVFKVMNFKLREVD
jgi:hypothetical protein